MTEWEVEFRAVLKIAFESWKARNERLSLRQFAAKIGLSGGAASEILNGKRALSLDRALVVIDKLELNKDRTRRLLALMGQPLGQSSQEVTEASALLLNDWVNHAILGMAEIPKADIDSKWIADRLNLAVGEIETRLGPLLDAGLLHRTDAGYLCRVPQHWNLREMLSSESLSRFFETDLNLARHALFMAPESERHFCSLTFVGDTKALSKFNSDVRLLLEKTAAKAEAGPQEDLLRISIQAFPIRFKT